jgi:hypothetical protein
MMVGIMYIFLNRKEANLSVLERQDVYGIRSESMCQYHIVGDPDEVGMNFVKIKFICSDGSESANTVAIDVLKNRDYLSLLGLFEEMFGVETSDFLNNFGCLNNSVMKISDLNMKIAVGDNIVCIEK